MKTPTRKCAATKPCKPEKGRKPKTMDAASPLKGTTSPRSINTSNTRASRGSISMEKLENFAAPSVEDENRSSTKQEAEYDVLEATWKEAQGHVLFVKQMIADVRRVKRFMLYPRPRVVDSGKMIHVFGMCVACGELLESAEVGYEDVKHSGYVCKLKEALYGLKQVLRAWHARIVAYLVSIGFHMADAGHSLYVRKNENDIVIICIYVDDLIIGGDNEGEIMHVKSLLKKEFDMKDLGELRYFLGIEIIHTKEGIWLSQRQYALDMLSKYGMADCKPISMLLDQNVKLRADEGQVLEDVTMYWQIVGSLIYLTISRPDLSYSVGLESQFMQLPRKPHLDVVRHTLRYVSATLDYVLFYEASMELQLSGFTDADWVGSACDRRSTSAFMFSLGSAAITWSSKKQPTVALSSTEAKYRGGAVAACEVVLSY
ncbi:hypothetical protein L7F22_042909 [Adiantum nelumboides]|nr:hypothetical protein [Adiantum nelumboides]